MENKFDEATLGEIQEETPTNKFDSVDIGPSDESQLRGSLFSAVEKNPDQQAKVLNLANKSGMPVPYVERNYGDVVKQTTFDGIDYKKLSEDTPALGGWLKNPDNASVAHDDIENLSYIEKQYRYIKSQYNQGKRTVEMSDLGFAAMMGNITPEQRERLKELDKEAQAEKDYGVTGFIEGVPGAVAQQLPIMGSTIVSGAMGAAGGAALGAGVGLIGGPVAIGTAGAGAFLGYRVASGLNAAKMEAALSYLDLEKETDMDGNPLDVNTMRGAATIVGAVNGSLELVGFESIANSVPSFKMWKRGAVKEIFKQITKKEAFLSAAKTIGEATAGEGITEGLQSLMSNFGKVIGTAYQNGELPSWNTEKVLSALEEAAQEAKAGAQGGGGVAVVPSVVSYQKQINQINEANKTKAAYVEFQKAQEKSKLSTRSPELQGEFVAEVAAEDKAYIPVDGFVSYFQKKGINPEEAAKSLGVEDQLKEALDNGGEKSVSQLEIPMSSYVKNIIGSEHGMGLADDIKFKPDALTVNEGKAEAQAIEEGIKAQNKELTEEQKANQELKKKQKADKVALFELMEKQYIEAGRSPLEAKTKATVDAERYQTRATLRNKNETALDVYNLAPITFRKGQEVLPEALKQEKVVIPEIPIAPDLFDNPNGVGEIEIPKIENSALRFIGGQDKPLILKESIIKKNKKHKISGEDSLRILKESLYSPTHIFQNQPKDRPDYWIMAKKNGKAKITIVEFSVKKDRNEIVGFREISLKRFQQDLDKAERDGGDIIITDKDLTPPAAARLSALTSGTDPIISENVAIGNIDGISKTIEKQRIKRAKEMGYNVNRTWYHGTNQAFDAFDLGMKQTGSGATSEGYGVYFTTDPDIAANYATRVGGNIIPVFLKDGNYISDKEKVTDEHRDLLEGLIKAAPDWENSVINYGDENPNRALNLAIDAAMNSDNLIDALHEIANTMFVGNLDVWGKYLSDNGIQGFEETTKYKYPVRVVINPSDIRSVNAEFKDLESTNILSQKEEKEVQGQISFGSQWQAIVDFFKGANASTVIHESMHKWLDELAVDATTEGTAESLRIDLDTLLEFSGLSVRSNDGLDAIRTALNSASGAAHEKVARAAEAYFREGVAPSRALKKAFRAFKLWMLDIYKVLVGSEIDVGLTDDVRGVFDRMLAAETEVERLELELNRQRLFTDPQFMGMSVENTNKYLKAEEEAKADTIAELQARLIKHHQKILSKEYKAEKKALLPELEKEVNKVPIYKALDTLQNGNLPNGERFQLNRQSVENFDPELIKRLPKGVIAVDKNSGLNTSVATELLGFESIDELLYGLAGIIPKKTYLTTLADQEMAKRYPDLISSPDLDDEVTQIYHNSKNALRLRMELEHLASNNMPVLKEVTRRVLRPASRQIPRDAVIKRKARESVSKKTVKDLDPRSYLRAEVKAAKEAEKLLNKGDIQGAFNMKLQELINHESYVAAVEAKAEIKKNLDKFKKIYKKDEDLAKSRDTDLVNAARAVLSSFGLGKIVKEPALSWLSSLGKYNPEGYKLMSELITEVTALAKPYEALTVDEFYQVSDAVNSLWDLSKSAKEIEIDGKVMELAPVIEEINVRMAEVASKKEQPGLTQQLTAMEKAKSDLTSLINKGRRVESWNYFMDKGSTNGIFNKAFQRKASTATTQYRTVRVDVFSKYAQVLAGFNNANMDQTIRSDEVNYTFTKPELIMAILHSGNDSNLEKLLVGRGWGFLDEEKNLNRRAWDRFLERAWSTGFINKADMDAIQALWDINESLKPEAQKTHRKVYGSYFSEITANEVRTPFGVYRGGYMPAIADPALNVDAGKIEVLNILEQGGTTIFPATSKGFTKQRVKAYYAPLSLDFMRIQNHIDTVLRFTYLQPAGTDILKVMSNREFETHAKRMGGDLLHGENGFLTTWVDRTLLQRQSKRGSSPAFDRGLKLLRSSVSMQFMAFNIVNATQNLLGVFPALTRISVPSMAGAYKRFIFDPRGMAEEVKSKSAFMNTIIGKNADEIINDANEIIFNPTKLQQVRERASAISYFPDKFTNQIVSVTTWVGAYNDAIADGKSESDAVYHADSTVRQVTAGIFPEDISGYESTTPFARLFTMFSTFFNTQANLLYTEAELAKEEGGASGLKRAGRAYALVIMFPAILSELIKRVMTGKGVDEDDDGEYFDDLIDLFFTSQARYSAAMIPAFGNMINYVMNRFNDKPFDDKFSITPVTSAIDKTFNVITSVPKALEDDTNQAKAFRDAMYAFGLVTRLPTNIVAKPVGYALEVKEGNIEPTGPIDYTRGLVTGTGKK